MDHCGPVQAQLLDFLYDLLEADEQRVFQEHLVQCALCQAALRDAQGQQQLLAAAARMEFPAVRFEPPPEVLPFGQRSATRPVGRSWKRALAICAPLAACILIALGLTADYRNARSVRDQGEGRLAMARQAVDELKDQLRRAKEVKDTRLAVLAKAAGERQFTVVVSGPETVQPGAPNTYHIQTRSLINKAVPAELTIRVRDDSRQIVEERKNIAVPNGEYTLTLPADLPVKPNAKLSLEVLARREGSQEKLQEELPLAVPLYATHLATDRPLYRPGDMVFFRSLTLERFSLKPPDEDFELVFQVRKPNKDVESLGTQLSRVGRFRSEHILPDLGLDGQLLHGLGAGEYRLPGNAPGGEWALIVSEAHSRFPQEERKFLVSQYEKQNLIKELEWSQRSYGPGEAVTANCRVETADHRKVRCAVTARVQINGTLIATLQEWTDAEGKVLLRFPLPKDVGSGNDTLSVTFHDGANVETINKPIPVVLNWLRTDFYPEGGDLVAGVSNRVYFQVHNSLQKPADLRGRIVDDTGKVVKENVATVHLADQPGANQGMGVFEFTPEAGRKYELKVDVPLGIAGDHPLPAVKTDGVLLRVPDGVSNPGDLLRVVVRSPGRERTLLVGAYCRGRLMDHQRLTVKADDTATVDLRPVRQMGGVYRITVFEEQPGEGRHNLKPLAERLVYRLPAHQLQLTASPEQPQSAPGDRVNVTIKATDEKGVPAAAVVLVAVVDRSVLALADEKTAHSLPTHFLLMSEVRRPEDLEHADFLLGPGPEARKALDLLLGTQGWRRFAEQHLPGTRPNKDLDRLLVSNGERSRPRDLQQRDEEKVRQDYREEVLKRNEQLVRAEEVEQSTAAALATPPFTEAAAKVAGYDRVLNPLRQWGLLSLATALLLAGLAGVILGAAQHARRVVRLGGLVALGCSLILGLVVAFQFDWGHVTGTTGSTEKLARDQQRPGPQVERNPPLVGPDKPPDQPRKIVPLTAGLPDRTVLLPPREAQHEAEPDLAEGRRKDRAEKQRRDFEHLALVVGEPVPPPPPPCIVREYAYQRDLAAPPGVRADFPETLYWHPALVMPDGRGVATFFLGDAVTSYQVAVMGHTLDGRLGAVTATVEARLPFSVDPKIPTEVSSTDKIDVPVSIANNTTEPRPVELRVAATGLAARDGGPSAARVTVPAGERRRRVFRFQPDIVEGEASLEVRGEARPFAADAIRRTFAVVPDGFPVVAAHSDLLEKSATHHVVLPQTWVKGTLHLQAEVYPSTLADLQKGLEALLHEPGGCFEQTSSSNYPNLLILDYLKETNQAKPEVESRARAMLDHGYQQLAKFECPYGQDKHGFEWFGAPNAAHEALTAYGLLEFRDMARVSQVDPALLERTRKYLLDQRDGQGGFKRNPRSLDTFGRAPQDVTNAYIVWALTETVKDDDLTKELNALAAEAKQSRDPYFLALVANSLLNRGRADEGVLLLKAVAGQQQEDGHVDAAKTSITGSGGRPLQVETTARAVLGGLKANPSAEFNGPVRKAVRWIGRQRGGLGGYGSTQSTILALKALIGYAHLNKKPAEGGEVRLLAGDAVLARTSFDAGAQDVLTVSLSEPEKHLHAGSNHVRVEITGDRNVFPYTLSWSYHAPEPPSAADAPVRLLTRLDRQTADEGDTLHLTVTVENATAQGQGMVVAVVGLPAGVTLPEDLKQLKQHAEPRHDGNERGLIDFFEVRGRELVLYWRDLAPHQKIEVPVDLICRVPGEYRGPASRAYLYYNGDAKCWIDPLQVHIKAKE
jgi:hypothetical protein